MHFRIGKTQLLSGLFLLVLLAACSSIKVLPSEAETGFRLSNYQTFDFYELDASGDALGENYLPQVELIKQEITANLEQRGLRRSATNPDLLINLGIVAKEQVQTRQTDIRSDPPHYIGQRRYTWKSREVEVGRYTEGTLSVHLVDRARNEMVWRGAAESIVPQKPEKQQQRIKEGVQKLLSEVPQ